MLHISHVFSFFLNKSYPYCPFSADTVSDTAPATRDNQDTVSGDEPPSDTTPKTHYLTDHPSTIDYDDATEVFNEEEGKVVPFLTDQHAHNHQINFLS